MSDENGTHEGGGLMDESAPTMSWSRGWIWALKPDPKIDPLLIVIPAGRRELEQDTRGWPAVQAPEYVRVRIGDRSGPVLRTLEDNPGDMSWEVKVGLHALPADINKIALEPASVWAFRCYRLLHRPEYRAEAVATVANVLAVVVNGSLFIGRLNPIIRMSPARLAAVQAVGVLLTIVAVAFTLAKSFFAPPPLK
jgi:hypothetical protein